MAFFVDGFGMVSIFFSKSVVSLSDSESKLRRIDSSITCSLDPEQLHRSQRGCSGFRMAVEIPRGLSSSFMPFLIQQRQDLVSFPNVDPSSSSSALSFATKPKKRFGFIGRMSILIS